MQVEIHEVKKPFGCVVRRASSFIDIDYYTPAFFSRIRFTIRTAVMITIANAINPSTPHSQSTVFFNTTKNTMENRNIVATSLKSRNWNELYRNLPARSSSNILRVMA